MLTPVVLVDALAPVQMREELLEQLVALGLGQRVDALCHLLGDVEDRVTRPGVLHPHGRGASGQVLELRHQDVGIVGSAGLFVALRGRQRLHPGAQLVGEGVPGPVGAHEDRRCRRLLDVDAVEREDLEGVLGPHHVGVEEQATVRALPLRIPCSKRRRARRRRVRWVTHQERGHQGRSACGPDWPVGSDRCRGRGKRGPHGCRRVAEAAFASSRRRRASSGSSPVISVPNWGVSSRSSKVGHRCVSRSCWVGL